MVVLGAAKHRRIAGSGAGTPVAQRAAMRLRVLHALVVLAVAGCAGGRRPPKADVSARPTLDVALPIALETGATRRPMTPPPAVVRLVDAGRSGARRPLAYRFSGARSESLRVDIRTTKASSFLASSARTVRLVVHVEPQGTDTAGDYRFHFRIERASLVGDEEMPKDGVQQMEAVLGEVRGRWGSAVISPRGALKELGWSESDGLAMPAHQVLVDLSRLLRQLYPPLPEEEVGVGARWEVTEDVSTEAYEMRSTSRFTLRALGDRSAELDLELEESAARQPLGGTASSGLVQLEKLEGSVVGSVRASFEPPFGRISLQRSMDARILVGRPRAQRAVPLVTASETTAVPVAVR
jgi:hypothetical protein